MNQGKLEVVKQERTGVNVDILRISELNWTGMGEFNSLTTILSTIAGRNPLEEMEKTSWSTEEFKKQYLDAISKMTE